MVPGGDPLRPMALRVFPRGVPGFGLSDYSPATALPTFAGAPVSGSWACTEFTSKNTDETLLSHSTRRQRLRALQGRSTSDISIKKYDGTNWTAPFTPITGITGYTTPVYRPSTATTFRIRADGPWIPRTSSDAGRPPSNDECPLLVNNGNANGRRLGQGVFYWRIIPMKRKMRSDMAAIRSPFYYPGRLRPFFGLFEMSFRTTKILRRA
jgi:hypothetical protein